MIRYRFLHPLFKNRKSGTVLLAFSWTLGLLFGLCAIVTGACNGAFDLAVDLKPSFLSVISVLFLPIVISFLAVFAGQRWLIFPLAFFKALAFAYVGWGTVVTFGSAGWLIRLLFMFSDCASVPVLLWFWNRTLTSGFDALFPGSVAALVTVLGIGIVDYGVIAPLLLNLSL